MPIALVVIIVLMALLNLLRNLQQEPEIIGMKTQVSVVEHIYKEAGLTIYA